MSSNKLNLAILGALSILSTQVFAAPGLVNLPVVGATTPYVACTGVGKVGVGDVPAGSLFGAGNMGSGVSVEPKTQNGTTQRVCATFPNNGATDVLHNTTGAVTTPYGSIDTSPLVGYTLVGSAARPVTMNNVYTGGVTKTVANVDDRVWRNGTTAAAQCIFGSRARMVFTAGLPANDPARLADGTYWEVNDIARAGFAAALAAGQVSAGYFRTGITDEQTFRIGRTYTSVIHQADVTDLTGETQQTTPSVALAYPLTAGATAGLNINTASQTAALSLNYVDFTTDINAQDPDLSKFPNSSMNYVKAPCPNGTFITLANAIRLRSTSQEGQPAIEANVSGFAPTGATVTP